MNPWREFTVWIYFFFKSLHPMSYINLQSTLHLKSGKSLTIGRFHLLKLDGFSRQERFGNQPPRLAAASLNFSRCNLDDEAKVCETTVAVFGMFFVNFRMSFFCSWTCFFNGISMMFFFPDDCVFFCLKKRWFFTDFHRCCSFPATLGNSSECCISRLWRSYWVSFTAEISRCRSWNSFGAIWDGEPGEDFWVKMCFCWEVSLWTKTAEYPGWLTGFVVLPRLLHLRRLEIGIMIL